MHTLAAAYLGRYSPMAQAGHVPLYPVSSLAPWCHPLEITTDGFCENFRCAFGAVIFFCLGHDNLVSYRNLWDSAWAGTAT